MHISVKAQRMGIVVMKNAANLDRTATQQLREKRHIEEGKIRDSFTFRPLLMVRYPASRPPNGSFVIVKTVIEKDGQFLWEHVQPQHGQVEIFYPNGNLFQLQNYIRRNNPVGLWRLTAHIAVMPGAVFEAIPAASIHTHLFSQVNYTEVATLAWRVIPQLGDQVDRFGNLRQPIANARQLQQIEVTLDEI